MNFGKATPFVGGLILAITIYFLESRGIHGSTLAILVLLLGSGLVWMVTDSGLSELVPKPKKEEIGVYHLPNEPISRHDSDLRIIQSQGGMDSIQKQLEEAQERERKLQMIRTKLKEELERNRQEIEHFHFLLRRADEECSQWQEDHQWLVQRHQELVQAIREDRLENYLNELEMEMSRRGLCNHSDNQNGDGASPVDHPNSSHGVSVPPQPGSAHSSPIGPDLGLL